MNQWRNRDDERRDEEDRLRDDADEQRSGDAFDEARPVDDPPTDAEDEIIPLEEKPESKAGPGQGDQGREKSDVRRSLLDEAEDVCPACGAALPTADAVVCTRCGYDFVANRPRSTEIGEVEIDEAESERDVFSRRRPLGVRFPVGVAIGAWALAAIGAGAFAQTHAVRAVVAMLVYVPVQIAIGLGAVVVTARLLEQRLGRIDVAAARISMCVALFAMFFSLGEAVNAHNAVQFLLGGALGLGAYFLCAWRLFSISPPVTAMLLSVHFAMWLVSEGLFLAVAWLKSAPTPTGP